MSELKVNKVTPRDGTTITLGDSGDTVALAAGATATGFGTEIVKQSSDPTVSTNPSDGVGSIILNITSGKIFVCTDATNGANVWQAGVDGTVQPQLPFMTATGGIITNDGDYKIHTFTTSGTFTPTVGSDAVGDKVEYLTIGGGGGGGSGRGDVGAGGGGAGGYRTDTSFSVSTQAYTITVGAGGSAGVGPDASPTVATSGADSIFSSITSTGGGYGSQSIPSDSYTGQPGGDGGSGGGGSTDASSGNSAGAGGSGNTPSTSPSQGNNGASSVGGSPYRSGGGGGASAAGSSDDGGNGTSSSITGSAVTRAGGGGGAYRGGGGNAGTGGGGAGAAASGAGDGLINTGSGGGGTGQASVGSNVWTGGAGGSGVVIIRYKFR